MKTIVSYMINGEAMCLPFNDYQQAVVVGVALSNALTTRVEILTTIEPEAVPASKPAATRARRRRKKGREPAPATTPGRCLAELRRSPTPLTSKDLAKSLGIDFTPAVKAASYLKSRGLAFSLSTIAGHHLWASDLSKLNGAETGKASKDGTT